ncbi:MRN complex-interacting protein [Anomaloglossus baeobatrachus]|uniref:MRN complex-interacting protein n=1 Tax=Anomaloglossus baeobatrachus TaxID=238106 RepID=UPI003F505716
MVQEFQVLRCYSCHFFQVHPVKKNKKWSCKLCGEKQTLLKVYGQGSGADCRHHVQKLNRLQGQVEQAATSTDGENHPNTVSNEHIGEESNESLEASQEAARSRWNKYLEEKNSEEEEGHIPTDHEHYYPHQDCTLRAVRKRKQTPYHEGDFYKEDMKETISKKNKIYQSGSPSETKSFCCRTSEDMGCLKWHDEPISHTLPPHTSNETVLPMNPSEGRFKQSTCSTASVLKREPKMDTFFNCFDRSKKIGPDNFGSNSQDIRLNNEPPTSDRLSVVMSTSGSSLGRTEQRSDTILETSSPPKPIIQSNLFQTDEDFDDDY